jgi:putative hydrolase of the HAD superfamily
MPAADHPPITALFIDIGGVLLTNGWDHASRELAAKTFDLNFEEMESRHRLTFDTYEMGKITLEEYIDRVVFYQPRSFSPNQFQEFMFAQSKAFPQMIELTSKIKAKHGLKVVVVSNEGRELNAYRIQKFKLDSFVDLFVSSSFVKLRKPDVDIFRIALDISQVPPNQVIYIEDRLLFVEVAEGLGIRSLHHRDYESTVTKLASFGLSGN